MTANAAQGTPSASKARSPACESPQPLQADAIVADIQAYYSVVTTFVARFRMDGIAASGPPRDSLVGTVWIHAPDRVRWQIYLYPRAKNPKFFIDAFVEGGVLHAALEHIRGRSRGILLTRSPARYPLLSAMPFLYGGTDLSAEFTASLDTSGTYGERGDRVVKLIPRSVAPYSALYLVVGPCTPRVRESVVVDFDSEDWLAHYRFYGDTLNAVIDDAQLVFDPKSSKFQSWHHETVTEPPPPATGPAGSAR